LVVLTPPKSCPSLRHVLTRLEQPFVKRFALRYQTVICPVSLSVCDVCVWPNGRMDQDETWQAGRPRPWPQCVRWRPSSASPKRGNSPSHNFGPCLLWPNGWMDQDRTWLGGGPRTRPHCARWGPSSPSQKVDTALNFRPISIMAKLRDASR